MTCKRCGKPDHATRCRREDVIAFMANVAQSPVNASLEPVNAVAQPVNAKPKSRDWHKPGYMAEYMRKYRALKKARKAA